MGEGGIFRMGTQAECVRGFLEKSRHWMSYRGIPIANIWVREWCRAQGEHFHFGYHQQSEFDREYAMQMADWLDEPLADNRSLEAEAIAHSIDSSWDIRRCVRGGTSGVCIAAYLGKAEPSEIITGWGKTKVNGSKPRRGRKGGQGPIEGNDKHAYRWGTSTSLARTQRDRHGFTP
ncbi:hypothetical protein DC363_16365 [Thalassorhabdomicrobium marinisediminis]|uniref:Uncharacterized protein n=1 Tax=Thalassorhabdomicrobium marinisediminis TaxID=2170577 RepID=A0A2T7FST4_9RHOB|nr:hypothetical protein DC363_16365 [Thalassorhabdomicrobium marinisediminis]